MELLKPAEAARELGVSYPTMKQWIYRGKVDSVKTPGGHHRVPRAEVDRLAGRDDSARRRQRTDSLPAISGRNRLRGEVVEVRYEGLLAQVLMDVSGQMVTAIITRSAAEELDLERGVVATALIKATGVMVIRE
jgi:molybdopterin-binding protein